MQRACDLIEQRHGIKLNLDNIPIDDKETFDFLSKGHTAGVFQLEGTGMTRFLVQMRPENLDNVIAMVALYRPGPLDFIPSYIRRMHKEEQVEYRHPAMEPIFEETYGIPVYQEQIMRAAVDLAGYTLSESDELRKAIAKKQKDKLEKHKIKFIKGAEERGIEHATAEGIFTDWEEFARYGFNKSHAADYGIIAVQTAYLKTHYTVEYMTALLSASKNDTAKVAAYVADSRTMGISGAAAGYQHQRLGLHHRRSRRRQGFHPLRHGRGEKRGPGAGRYGLPGAPGRPLHLADRFCHACGPAPGGQTLAGMPDQGGRLRPLRLALGFARNARTDYIGQRQPLSGRRRAGS